MDLREILSTTIEVAREAGELLRRGYGDEGLAVRHKSSASDWVTQFDLASEKLIIGRLTAAFPEYGVVSEEGGQYEGNGSYFWFIDPLDGTNNFAHGLPVFSVSIALYENGRPLVGVVYDPLRDECFGAARGHGAHLAGRKGSSRPIKVSQTEMMSATILGTGFPYDKHQNQENNLAEMAAFLKHVQGLRRLGSAALDLAYVAAGRLDGFWEYRLNSWDVAAGYLLVMEAGGQVTLLDGRPFALRPQLSLVVSNGRIHQQMLDILATVYSGNDEG